MVGGALLAPPAWWLGQWAIRIGLVPGLRPFAFDKYFNRAALVLALVMLPWLVRSLRLGSWQALGIDPNMRRWSDFTLGLGVALAGFALTIWALTAADLLALRPHVNVKAWLSALLAAGVVGCLEELLFRGIFFGVLRRNLPTNFALAAMSMLFASLHFLRPNPALPKTVVVTYLSGLQLLPHLLWEYAQPGRLWASWATLSIMAWILGDTVLKTRSLYAAIGLHAGWVFAVKALSLSAQPQSRQDFWLGSDWRSGAAPLLLMLTSAIVMRLALRYRGVKKFDAPTAQAPASRAAQQAQAS